MRKNKIMDKIIEFKKNYPIMLLYILGNFINAILLILFTTGRFQARALLIDFGVVCLLAGLSLLVKRKKFYYIFTTFIMVLICVVNSLYYNYYSSFVSVSLLATSVFVKDVGDAIVQMVVRPCDLTYLWMFVALYIYYKNYIKKHAEKIINKKYISKFLLVSFIKLPIASSI